MHDETLSSAASGCYCLCSFAHPTIEGICDGQAVTTRPFGSTDSSVGVQQVQMCAPCAVALDERTVDAD